MKEFAPALKHIADIIERGIREHPELSVGMQTEGIEASLFDRNIPNQHINVYTEQSHQDRVFPEPWTYSSSQPCSPLLPKKKHPWDVT